MEVGMVVGEAVPVTEGVDKCAAFSRAGSMWADFRGLMEMVLLHPLRAIVKCLSVQKMSPKDQAVEGVSEHHLVDNPSEMC